MSFLGAYKSFWKNYFNFKGRATRREYWFVALWNFIITLPLLTGLMVSLVKLIFLDLRITEIDFNSGSVVWVLTLSVLSIVYAVAVFIPNLSIAVRRFHDVGLSGWWYGGPYILVTCISIIVGYIEIPLELSVVIALISLIVSIGTFIVTVLPSDKFVKKQL